MFAANSDIRLVNHSIAKTPPHPSRHALAPSVGGVLVCGQLSWPR